MQHEFRGSRTGSRRYTGQQHEVVVEQEQDGHDKGNTQENVGAPALLRLGCELCPAVVGNDARPCPLPARGRGRPPRLGCGRCGGVRLRVLTVETFLLTF